MKKSNSKAIWYACKAWHNATGKLCWLAKLCYRVIVNEPIKCNFNYNKLSTSRYLLAVNIGWRTHDHKKSHLKFYHNKVVRSIRHDINVIDRVFESTVCPWYVNIQYCMTLLTVFTSSKCDNSHSILKPQH